MDFTQVKTQLGSNVFCTTNDQLKWSILKVHLVSEIGRGLQCNINVKNGDIPNITNYELKTNLVTVQTYSTEMSRSSHLVAFKGIFHATIICPSKTHNMIGKATFNSTCIVA